MVKSWARVLKNCVIKVVTICLSFDKNIYKLSKKKLAAKFQNNSKRCPI